MSSPENLGKVVDIQLREQILMYDNLLDQYNQIQQEKSRLNEQIEAHIQNINALELKCRRTEDENSSNVKRYEDKMEELAVLTAESEMNLKEFQLLRTEFDALMSKANESHQRIDDLNSAKSSLEHRLNVCENEVVELRDSKKTIAAENANHLLNIERLAASESKLKLDVEHNSDLIDRLQVTILQLQDQIAKGNEREVALQYEIDRLTKLLDDLHIQIDHIKRDGQTLSEQFTVSMNEKDAALQKVEQDRDERIVELEHQMQLVR